MHVVYIRIFRCSVHIRPLLSLSLLPPLLSINDHSTAEWMKTNGKMKEITISSHRIGNGRTAKIEWKRGYNIYHIIPRLYPICHRRLTIYYTHIENAHKGVAQQMHSILLCIISLTDTCHASKPFKICIGINYCLKLIQNEQAKNNTRCVYGTSLGQTTRVTGAVFNCNSQSDTIRSRACVVACYGWIAF